MLGALMYILLGLFLGIIATVQINGAMNDHLSREVTDCSMCVKPQHTTVSTRRCETRHRSFSISQTPSPWTMSLLSLAR